ncbi:MAG: aldo/keto reductase, partial [Polyangiaceae bacterium]
RFSGEAGGHNDALVDELRAFAAKGGRTPAQLCMAWALTKEPSFVPLSGARTLAQLDVLDMVDRPLSSEELSELERLIPKGAFKGSRYPEAQMGTLDSER